MKTEQLLTSLNEMQRQAVSAPACHILVLAGAGSGKTRVLAHRIVWLIKSFHVSPYSILAVTFTNKAAYEMRERIQNLCEYPVGGMWIGTFHGLSHRLLRQHWREAHLPESFQILDSDDQLRLIRRIHKNLRLDEDKWPPKQSQWYINNNKDEGRRAGQVIVNDYFAEVLQRIYLTYENLCQQSGLVDFGELLLRSLELLQQNDELRQFYQTRFKHILVDEFQDTNAIQYQWLRLFTGKESYLMAVGDDDQSIYSWRGAKIENIHRFSRDFVDCQIIRLEQNYRSSATILQAANAVIDHNRNRMGKNLWTEGRKGEPITLYAAFNEYDEAHYVVAAIRNGIAEGFMHKDFAILYRSNAQSRIFEEQLIQEQIPYHIYGGLKFFERAEIKDALAYLRLLTNRFDDAAFERIINTPSRGIGNTTLIKLREVARDQQQSLWQTALHVIQERQLATRAHHALQQFINLIDTMTVAVANQSLEEQTHHVLYHSGLMDFYKRDKSEKSISRIENLEELIAATAQFDTVFNDEEISSLNAFLAHVALESGDEQAPKNTNCVHLMTLHAAKGLEFPVVFIAGMEEDLFPHKMSAQDSHGLEEERRLCYVGMTRAMQKLYLCYAEVRRVHGMEKFHRPSRFIAEIPDKLIQAIRPKAKVREPFFPSPSMTISTSAMGFQLGQRVFHQKFGHGIIINFEGKDEHTRIQVKFDEHGEKWLVANFANLVSC